MSIGKRRGATPDEVLSAMSMSASQTDPSNRTQRRWRRTHDALIAATIDSLVRLGAEGTTTKTIADGADVAVGTVHNHFGDVDAAVDAAIDPVRAFVFDSAQHILDADDYDSAVASWIARYLHQIETEPEAWVALFRSGRSIYTGDSAEAIAELMRERWSDEAGDRQVRPGGAGVLMSDFMAAIADIYGGALLPPATVKRLARVLFSTAVDDSGRVERAVARIVAELERRRENPAGVPVGGSVERNAS